MEIRYKIADIRASFKKENNVWNVIFTEPIALRIVWFLANFTRITPNILTFIGFIFVLLSSFLFFKGELLLGALIYEFAFLFDTWDGKLARTKNIKSPVGSFFDTIVDTLRPSFASLSICWWAFQQTEQLYFIFIGFAYPMIILLSQVLFEVAYKLNEKQQLMSVMSKETLLQKIKAFFAKYRLRLGYTSDETNTIAFLFAPILAFFFGINYILYGIIAASALMLFLIILFVFLQARQLAKKS